MFLLAAIFVKSELLRCCQWLSGAGAPFSGSWHSWLPLCQDLSASPTSRSQSLGHLCKARKHHAHFASGKLTGRGIGCMDVLWKSCVLNPDLPSYSTNQTPALSFTSALKLFAHGGGTWHRTPKSDTKHQTTLLYSMICLEVKDRFPSHTNVGPKRVITLQQCNSFCLVAP